MTKTKLRQLLSLYCASPCELTRGASKRGATAMMTRRRLLAGSAATVVGPLASRIALAEESSGRATVLFDAFGKPSNLKRGWGYSVFIEYGGRRILFDTGGRGADFAYGPQPCP